MRQGPLTAIAWRPSRLPFNGCTLQPGMFRSETAVAAWSASIALLQRLCKSCCTFRLLPVSKSSRNPACRKLTITVSSVKHTRHGVNCRFTLRPAPDSSRHTGLRRQSFAEEVAAVGEPQDAAVGRSTRLSATGSTPQARTMARARRSGLRWGAHDRRLCTSGSETRQGQPVNRSTRSSWVPARRIRNEHGSTTARAAEKANGPRRGAPLLQSGEERGPTRSRIAVM